MRPHASLTASLTLLAAAALAASPARAGGAPSDHVGLDLRVGATSSATMDLTHFQPTLFGAYRVAPKVRLTGAWGMAYTDVSTTTSSDSDASFSNVVLAGHYLLLDGGVRLTAGGGVGIPILSAPSGADGVTFLLNDVSAMAVRGRLGDPLWVPDTVTFFVPVRASVRFTNGLWLRAGVDVDVYIPTDEGDTNLGSLLTLDLAYRAGGIIPGVRLTGDWQITSSGDNFQAALEPYVRVNYTWGFARLGFLMNLDAPQGGSFDSGKLWGVVLRAGYKL